MKQNKIFLGVVLLTGAFTINSCSKSFLEVKPKGQVLESNYYSSPGEALAGVVAAYAPAGIETQNTYCSPLGVTNSASDECYAGGGGPTDMDQWQAMNDMTKLTSAKMPVDMWNVNFQGVNFSNLILSKLDGVPGLSDADRARYTAEAKFLRAYYYFHLVRWFGNVPLFTAPQSASDLTAATQVAPAAVYAQIEKDLTDAITTLPPTVQPAENGRATQGAAKALLGKVFLYEKKWTDAANVLKDVNGTPGGTSQYGYQLMTNYGDVFSPGHKFNSESIFEIQHTSTQNYDWNAWGNYKSNVYCIMIGPRAYSQKNAAAPAYLSGWSFNPITPDLVDAMVVSGKYDPRYQYTITNLDSLMAAGDCAYDKTQCYSGTGYFMVKFAPLLPYTSATGVKELNFGIDYIEIRLADAYLMEAEALVNGGGDKGRAQQLLDAVRGRVGLPSVPVTLDAIKNERHLELATEGHRFFDLVRWGDADKVLNHMQVASNLGAGATFPGTKHFTVGKNEVLPVPLAELTNTQMKQNPGY